MKLPGDNMIIEGVEFPKYPNEIGMKVGYLEILYEIICDNIPGVVYMLRCKCGKEVLRRRGNLYQGFKVIQSCGCYKTKFGGNFKHGNARTGKEKRLYWIWNSMKQRCCNSNNPGYKDYGGRGIKIYDDWLDDYNAFRKWAKKNGYRKDLTIERKDVNGGYNPNNCTWIPKEDQPRNRRNNSKFLINGEWILQEDLARKIGVTSTAIKNMAINGKLKYEKWERGSGKSNIIKV